jgi:competence protein ComEA
MLKKFLAVLAMLYAAACFAAVDVNTAKAADLDGIKGIGPAMSKRIMDERKKGEFKSWDDLISRVKGIGEGNAAKFSADGMTVKGEAFKKAAATKETRQEKKEDKQAAKEDKKADKAAAKEVKKEAKAEKKEEKAAAKDAKKDDKKDDKTAAAAKPAASGAKK